MTVSGDFRCRECGLRIELFFDGALPATHSGVVHTSGIEGEDCPGSFDRAWTAPHTGRGSSGEPAR